MTHNEILDKDKDDEKYDKKFNEKYNELESDNLYNDNPETAFRLLLRLNIDEDNRQEEGKGRMFDFSIWDRNDSRGRSLEHIYPKSKVIHIDYDDEGNEILKDGNNVTLDQSNINNEYIKRENCYHMDGSSKIIASEHSIGNLVLLYKDENSSFNNIPFETKKSLFFKLPQYDINGKVKDKQVKEIFKSRHLLHTIFKFANSQWNGEDIAKNKSQILKEFKEYYGK